MSEITSGAVPAIDNGRAILAMLASMAAFVCGDLLVKLSAGDLPLGEVVFVRGVAASLIILALAWTTGAFSATRHLFSGPILVRTVCDVAATHLFFTGLLLMPFADATAIGQFTSLVVTAAAALFLGERIGWRRWLATLAGLIGVMIIIRPGTSAFNWAALYILACVVSVAVRDLVTRRIAADVPTLLIALVTMVAVMVSGGVRGLFEVWTMPSPSTLLMITAAAVTNCIGYYCGIVAMRAGTSAAVEPFRYTAILFGLLLGYAVFGEVPDFVTIAGIAVVMGAGLYTVHRERVRGVLRDGKGLKGLRG